MARQALNVTPGRPTVSPDARTVIAENVSNELVFGIVGHVGSGNTTVAEVLKDLLEQTFVAEIPFSVDIIKARTVIESGLQRQGKQISTSSQKLLTDVEKYQDAGDELRQDDHAAIARGAVAEIRKRRAQMQGVSLKAETPVVPDGKPRAYIVDSIRHPSEVGLLRRVYGDGFVLVGVVCEHDERLKRISKKYADAGEAAAKKFMERDSKAPQKHGQRVSDAFHLSDFFVDNTATRLIDGAKSNPKWEVTQDLERLIVLVTHRAVARPTTSETAMHAAAGAAMRSACLSRQVGAALVDREGNLVATGTNEVPKAGGGVYGSGFVSADNDHRCAYGNKYCSNTKEQIKIAEELLEDLLGDDKKLQDKDFRDAALKRLRDGRIGDLLEFSRAVHAEMDALLSAGRKGASTIATRLFVTTFPCHYCARHIVSAGVDEVQFIEPYPKSKALTLHKDSIQFEIGASGLQYPSDKLQTSKQEEKEFPKTLFRPFTGVAPRMYRRAFEKDRELKNKVGGQLEVQAPDWGTPYDQSSKSYAEVEAALTKSFES